MVLTNKIKAFLKKYLPKKLFNFRFLFFSTLVLIVFQYFIYNSTTALSIIIYFIIAIYIYFGYTLFFYEKFRKDKFLKKLFGFLIIFILFILLFNFNRDFEISILLPIFLSAICVMTFFTFYSLLSFPKFFRKHLSYFSLAFSIALILVTFFLFVPFKKVTEINANTFVVPTQKAVETVTNFYYQKVNPSAGIVYFEQQFKAQINSADKSMNEANAMMEQLLREKVGNKPNDEIVKDLINQKAKLYEIFLKREKSLNAIIAIDDLGYGMSLPTAQKEFYKKRKLADENELMAFQTYKMSKTAFIEGYIIYDNFWRLFHAVYGRTTDKNNVNFQDSSFIASVKELDDYYSNEVKKGKDNKVLSKDIFDEMDRGYEMMGRFISYYLAYTQDPNSQDTQDKATYLNQGFSQPAQDTGVLFQAWLDQYIAPAQYYQDQIHNDSYNLFGQAYNYAKQQNMKGIFSVWKNDYPGYDYGNTVKQATGTPLTKEQLNLYYQIYDKPYIKYIRTALDEYLKGDPNNVISAEAKTKKTDADFIYGLDSFDSSYYKSKFVVYWNEDYVSGGKVSTIIFQDKPDKFFTAWTYETAKDTFILRGFWSHKIQNEDNLKIMNSSYKELLMDKVHSL